MTIKTNATGSNQPKLAVYNLNGVLVATSYKTLSGGQVQFWHFREQKTLTMSLAVFNANYSQRVFELRTGL